MLSVFFSFCVFRVWFGVFCRFLGVLLFSGSLFENIFGSELLFLGVVVGLVFLVGFCQCFCFIFDGSLPKMSGKVSWCQVCCFLGSFSLPLVFFSSTSFCFVFSRDTAQVVTGHPYTHLVCLFLLHFCPAALVFCSPFLAVRPASVVFRGAILGPVRFWDSPGTYGARACSPLLRPLFLGREAARGFCVLLVLGFCFSPSVLFCGFTLFPRRPANGSTYGRPGALDVPPPSPSEGWGEPLWGRRVGPFLFWEFVAVFVWQRVTGTLGRTASRAFLLARGRFGLPPLALFHTHVFVPAQDFLLAFEASFAMESQTLWENAVRILTSESCSENSPKNSVTPKPRHVQLFSLD